MFSVTSHLDRAGRKKLEKFLCEQRAAERASIDHDPRWLEVLQRGLGHRPMPVTVMDGTGQVAAYLPLSLVKSKLFGRFLVSLPYVNTAGVVASSAQAAGKAVEQAAALADQHRVHYVELRHGEKIIEHEQLGQQRNDKVRMVLELPQDQEALFAAVGSKVRNQIRKGQKHGLRVRFGGQELLPAFYRIFAVNMRDLGTPVYPRRLFELILDRFADEAELAVVWHERTAVAGALLMHDEVARQTQVPSASCLRQFNFTNANMWMYHQLLCRAMERGSRTFDFGRSSRDSGTYRFKKQWGAKPVGTVWQYHLRRGQIGAMRPDNPKYQRRIAAWQKLPVWVTRLAGPAIVRGIP